MPLELLDTPRNTDMANGHRLLLGFVAATAAVAVGAAGFLARLGKTQVVVRFVGYLV